MEKGPEFRIVGDAPQEIKEDVKKEHVGRFSEKHLKHLPKEWVEKLQQNEEEKDPRECALITLADKETSERMKEAGVSPFRVPERNIHVVLDKIMNELGYGSYEGISMGEHQAIAINRGLIPKDNAVRFGLIVFHELMHLKGQTALETEINAHDEKPRTTIYKKGVSIYPSQKKLSENDFYEYFRGLEEAIVSSEERRYYEKMLEDPSLHKEREWLKSKKAKQIKKKIGLKKSIDPEEITWLSEDGKDHGRFSYPKPYAVLLYVCEEIQKEFPQQYSSPEEVRKEFVKSQFTGRSSLIAKLIEKTFGEGNFRVLGTMDPHEASATRMLELLRRARVRKIRGSNAVT